MIAAVASAGGARHADDFLRAHAWPDAAHAVLPRAHWGADETLRLDALGAERWPEQQHNVLGIVLHHTCGPSGQPDAVSRLRGIYRFHAVDRGWGDIGYHLIIDQAGHVYEGRHGTLAAERQGTGVIGAHALGFNRGSLAIALLGTLSEQDAAPPAREALVAILAQLVTTHGIDPTATVSWPRAGGPARLTAPAICAHRDLANVDCPGDAFYATLPALRDEVAQRLVTASAAACPALTGVA